MSTNLSKIVFWPKADSLNIYFAQSEDNLISFEMNLWSQQSSEEITRLSQFLKSKKITSASVLIDDSVVFTRSFVYDEKVTEVGLDEVVTLAKGSAPFEIIPSQVTYEVLPLGEKTLIQARIFDQAKLAPLLSNLSALNLKLSYFALSESLVKLFDHFYDKPYFVFYSLDSEYLVTLGYQGKVYLTSLVKKTLVDVKKIINYSQAYFGTTTTKVFLPSALESIFDIPDIEKSVYTDSQVVLDLKLPSNLPLPVAGIIDIPMENKKNILPIIAVALFTAIIAAVIVWFALNQNSKPTEVADPKVAMITPIPTDTVAVTPTPEIVVVEPSKSLKIQVLNATDISGQAAVIKEKLTKLGFTSVNIGNATEKVTANNLQIKSSLSTSSAYFTSSVSDFASANVTDLKANSTYDVVFVIGTDLKTGTSAPITTVTVTPSKAATSTPKATPTL
ncbi:MAG: LytR C-terminal domain-containing protein [Candidatus Shapirobacteria bacterium]